MWGPKWGVGGEVLSNFTCEFMLGEKPDKKYSDFETVKMI